MNPDVVDAMLYEAALARANRALDEARQHAAEREPAIDTAWRFVMDEWTAARKRLDEVSRAVVDEVPQESEW